MTAGFRRNMSLGDMSADMLNRIACEARKLSMPRTPLPPEHPRPENYMVHGINDTGQTLVDRSIVAIFDEYYFDTGGIITRSARTRAFGDPVTYRFTAPEYPQPEPNEDGKMFWPFPELRLGVIRAAQPVEPGKLAHAMIYGHTQVHIRMNEPQQGEEPYRFATFVDQNTDILQSAPTGPAMIISGELGYAQDGNVYEATIFFPCTAQALDQEEEDDGDDGEDGVTIQKYIDLCRVVAIQNEGRTARVQRMRFNVETGKVEDFGEVISALTTYGYFAEQS